MYDFKTFAQMNLDFIFSEFSRMPSPGEEVLAKKFTLQLGGGAIVCPIVLKRLGYKVRLGTFMGNDQISSICAHLLDQKGFDSFDLFQTNHPHPVVVTSVFSWPHDRGFMSYNERVNESSVDSQTVYDFLKDSKIVFAPIGHPEVARKLHEKGVKIIYDNGWNDDLSIDEFKEFLPYVDVYTPNDREAMKLAGTDQLEEALRFLMEYTPNPVVTLGKDGCAWWKDGEIVYVPSIEGVSEIDSTGAGDNFLAGIVYGMLQNEPMEKCLKLGNIFAGYSTTAIGCFGTEISKEIIDQYDQ